MKKQIEKFCKNYGLGTVTGEPRTISGGLLHTMYRVETDRGIFAVKVLNPEIMQRPEALQNMINSEKISHALCGVVPLVAAKEWEGNHLAELDGTWFMVFDWISGASVFAPDITVEHCAKIGWVLGKIHAAGVHVEGLTPSEEVRKVFAWEDILHEWKQAVQREVQQKDVTAVAKDLHAAAGACCKSLEGYLPELLRLDAETVAALQQLSTHQIVSHRDLDPKNVMWQGGQPYLIDWEAAGYVNPYQELAEVLNYWITDADGACNYEKFKALMREYSASIDVKSVDWDTVLKCSFDGMLGWLEYNVRRAAGLVESSEADRLAGAEQTCGTIAEIKRQKAQMAQLKKWLEE